MSRMGVLAEGRSLAANILFAVVRRSTTSVLNPLIRACASRGEDPPQPRR
jgi:hypothetical protein